MQVEELVGLTGWIEDNIARKEIIQKYAALQGKLAHNAKGSQQQPHADERQALIDALQSVALERLTHEQQRFLDDMGIAPHVGAAGVEKLERILFRDALDIATAASKLQVAVDELTQAQQKSSQIRGGLVDLVSEEPTSEDAPVVIRLTFARRASISNVVELKDWSATWHRIGHGLAIAHGASAESVRVIGAGRGSVVLVLGTTLAIATTLSQLILQGLKVAERVLDIKKKAEEIRGLKLKNDQLATDIEREAVSAKREGAEEVAETLVAELDLNDGEGDKAAAFRHAVQQVLDFLEKGGEIDTVLPSIPDADGESEASVDPKQLETLRGLVEKVRQLEATTRLLDLSDEGEAGD